MTRQSAQLPIPGTQPIAADRRTVRCAGCGRGLTDAESRLCGCDEKSCGHTAAAPHGWDITQEQLPEL